MTIRVLLVDDSWEVRERLRILLLRESDIELVGEAVSGEEAFEMLRRTPADVVVMDLNLQEVSGIETARRILLERPDIRVVIISLQSDPNYVKAGFRAGVTGYCSKTAPSRSWWRPSTSWPAAVRTSAPRSRSGCRKSGEYRRKDQGFD